MKQGITIINDYDRGDRPIVRIVKRRGKLTLEEVSDLLLHEGWGAWQGHYAIVLNCSESVLGGVGLFDDEEPKGDALDLYPLENFGDCPVCGKMTPPFQYCPNCGESWKDTRDNIEKRLASMREETEREIRKPSLTPAARAAWYWSFIGSVDMTRQLGLITDKRRLEIYKEVEHLKPKRSEDNGYE